MFHKKSSYLLTFVILHLSFSTACAMDPQLDATIAPTAPAAPLTSPALDPQSYQELMNAAAQAGAREATRVAQTALTQSPRPSYNISYVRVVGYLCLGGGAAYLLAQNKPWASTSNIKKSGDNVDAHIDRGFRAVESNVKQSLMPVVANSVALQKNVQKIGDGLVLLQAQLNQYYQEQEAAQKAQEAIEEAHFKETQELLKKNQQECLASLQGAQKENGAQWQKAHKDAANLAKEVTTFRGLQQGYHNSLMASFKQSEERQKETSTRLEVLEEQTGAITATLRRTNRKARAALARTKNRHTQTQADVPNLVKARQYN
jgi:hypothetical protein